MQIEECKVVNVNLSTRTIRVERVECNNLVSGEIPLFKGMDIPSIDEFVVCIFSSGKGFLLGELE